MPRRQPVLPIRHHGLPGGEAGGDQRPPILHLRDRHRPHRRDAVGHRPDIGPVRTALHGRRRHGQPVRDGFDDQARLHELARPEHFMFIGEHGAQRDRPAGRIHGVVDHREPAGAEFPAAVLRPCLDARVACPPPG